MGMAVQSCPINSKVESRQHDMPMSSFWYLYSTNVLIHDIWQCKKVDWLICSNFGKEDASCLNDCHRRKHAPAKTLGLSETRGRLLRAEYGQ